MQRSRTGCAVRRACPRFGADGDRQGRAADHRPRAARAVRLPAAGAAGRGRRRQRAAGPVRAPPRARRRRRGRRVERAAPGAPRRADRGPGGRGDRRSWCGSGSGWRASTARRPPGGWSWCCRPGVGRGGRSAPRPAARAPARLTDAGRAALGGRHAARPRQRAALEALRSRARPAASWPPPSSQAARAPTAQTLQRLEAPRPGRASRPASAAGGRRCAAVGARSPRPR